MHPFLNQDIIQSYHFIIIPYLNLTIFKSLSNPN